MRQVFICAVTITQAFSSEKAAKSAFVVATIRSLIAIVKSTVRSLVTLAKYRGSNGSFQIMKENDKFE